MPDPFFTGFRPAVAFAPVRPAPASTAAPSALPKPVVAVIDDDFDLSHPVLARAMWTNPKEIAGDGIDNDGNGVVDDVHGTVICAEGSGGSGMLDGAHSTPPPPPPSFLPLGSLVRPGQASLTTAGCHGTSTASIIAQGSNAEICGVGSMLTSGIPEGFEQAADYLVGLKRSGANIRIVNCSFGEVARRERHDRWQAAAQKLLDADILIVAAADEGTPYFGLDMDQRADWAPGNLELPNVVHVAALDEAQTALASYSGFGAQSVDLAAPGSNIQVAAAGGGLARVYGTSAATAEVSVLAARILEGNPNLSALQLKEALLQQAKMTPELAGKVRFGKVG